MVAVGNAGVITSSSNAGVTWLPYVYQTGANLNGVAYSPTATIPWYAVGAQIQMTSLDGLTWVTSCAATAGKRNIFYSADDNQYVISGSNGFLATSPDLVTFTGRVNPSPTFQFNSGTYGGGVYVVAGNSGHIIVSTNAGVTWVLQAAGVATNMNDVVYFSGTSPPTFVAVGVQGRTTRSSNGALWTAQILGGGVFDFNAITASGSLLVAVGTAGAVWTSPDGATWIQQLSVPTTQALVGVAWNGSLFCAVGGALGVVITSPDGVTWTKQAPTGTLNSAAWLWITSDGAGNFYATKASTGNQAWLFVSVNGINWTPYYCPVSTLSVNWMNNQLVAYFNLNTNIAASTTGGQTWTVKTRGNPSTNGVTWNKLYWSTPANEYMLTSNIGFYSSANGQLLGGIGNQPAQNVIYGQGKLVVTGQGGSVMVSTNNGTSFTAAPNICAAADNMQGIAYSPSLGLFGLFVAVSSGGGPRSGIWYSSDGTVWTQAAYTLAYLGNSPLLSLGQVVWAAAPGMFVVVGTINNGGVGTILTSTNGTTWTTAVTSIGAGILSICYNTALGLFVAGGGNGLFFTSTNGVSWTQRLAKVTLESLAIVQTMEALGFVAVTAGAVGTTMFSKDGVTWALNTGVLNVQINNFGASLYSAADNGVFVISNTFLAFTNDGQTWQPISTFSPSHTNAGITYNSATDSYVVVGGAFDNAPISAWICTLKRSYDKNSQFVLPVLQNRWIKALP